MRALEVAKAEIALCELGGPRADDASLAADALLLMARRTLSGCFRGSAKASDTWFRPDMGEVALDDPTPEQSGPSHLVTVHVEESVLRGEGGTSDLPTPAVRRLLCDDAVVGIVDDGDGSPLSIGRRTRTVPVGMRRALQARDRTCRYPGCHHGRWLDAHHVVHWADGGETNLASYCSAPTTTSYCTRARSRYGGMRRRATITSRGRTGSPSGSTSAAPSGWARNSRRCAPGDRTPWTRLSCGACWMMTAPLPRKRQMTWSPAARRPIVRHRRCRHDRPASERRGEAMPRPHRDISSPTDPRDNGIDACPRCPQQRRRDDRPRARHGLAPTPAKY